MKRFRRALLNILTLMLLVLSLAVASAWVRGYWRRDDIYFASRDNTTIRGIAVLENRVGLFTAKGHMGWVERGMHYDSSEPDDTVALQHSFLGVKWGKREPNWTGVTLMAFVIPTVYLLVLFGTLPAVRFHHYVRRHGRPLAGHCHSCGYDLRATPDRCPECGNVPEKVNA